MKRLNKFLLLDILTLNYIKMDVYNEVYYNWYVTSSFYSANILMNFITTRKKTIEKKYNTAVNIIKICICF
jgi:hypothetical protein